MNSFKRVLAILENGRQTACVYCGYSFISSPEAMRFATIEHLLPCGKASGRRGSNCENNTYLCCFKCNTVRKNSLPEGVVKAEVLNPSNVLPTWLVEAGEEDSKRYYIKNRKFRDKLICQIREEFIIPESLKLFETWKRLFWRIEREESEDSE